jgi:hypothetical protein
MKTVSHRIVFMSIKGQEVVTAAKIHIVGPLRYHTVWSGRWAPNFRTNILAFENLKRIQQKYWVLDLVHVEVSSF